MMIDLAQIRQNFSGNYGFKGQAAADGKHILLVKDYSKPIMITDNQQKEIDRTVQEAFSGILSKAFSGGNMKFRAL